jgi:hypothetical protein
MADTLTKPARIGAHGKKRGDPVLPYSTWVALVSLGYQDSNLD